MNLVFLAFSIFLLETKGSDLSRKVREAIPVHLVLVWSESNVMVPSYGEQNVVMTKTMGKYKKIYGKLR